jgi:hypothetical protein
MKYLLQYYCLPCTVELYYPTDPDRITVRAYPPQARPNARLWADEAVLFIYTPWYDTAPVLRVSLTVEEIPLW